MHEYVTVSSSSYDPASLAAKLTEKSAEGWTVVAIVPTGGDVTAFLSREGTGASTEAAPEQASTPVMAEVATEAAPEPEPVAAETPEPVSEPAGWAVAPEPTPEPEPAAATESDASAAPATIIASSAPGAYDNAATSYQPAAAAPTPAVPAGWYADPAGRFELRYWDGNTWTEHVSRGGQQYTDAPVA